MIAVVTTFSNDVWHVYAKEMLQSFVRFWPNEIPLLVQLDDDLLLEDVRKILREGDGVTYGRDKEHISFVERNKGRDSPTDYRKQAVRFCHKVFAINHTLRAIEEAKKAGAKDTPRYLIWMDADVITTSQVTREILNDCLPKEGATVAYLGRKDWDHSECGWLAFDLENDGEKIIELMMISYINDLVFQNEQWHDSWIFDHIDWNGKTRTNLTQDKPGMDIWQHSPMAKFSTHKKGPFAKSKMKKKERPLIIETKNSIPNESIQRNILENQAQITNWVTTCLPNDEEIVVVSAGPMMIPEDVECGKKIVAVKHALGPLKEAGIKPWACILLDPRPHVNDFVENPDTNIIWFVASQVEARVVKTLLDAGCIVWGYHATVGAQEAHLFEKQPDSVVKGGSATSTRGLFLLEKLGFRKFRLYGYDLCCTEKPDLDQKDEAGQPKYFEVTIEAKHVYYRQKRTFWSTGELLAQYQEINDIIMHTKWHLRAFGNGIVPFMIESKRIGDLRERAKKDKIISKKKTTYNRMLRCSRKKNLLANWLNPLRKILQRQKAENSF